MPVKRSDLAARRRAVGFSQDQLAERLRVDRSTVARWESGENQPQPWMRPRLARALAVSVDQLGNLLSEPDSAASETDTGRLDYTLSHPSGADLVTVAQLRREVQRLDEQYILAPSCSLLADAGQALGQIRFLAANAADLRVRRDLYAVEAEAAILMGQLVWDASQRRDHESARLYFDQAAAAARQVRDPAAEGLALLRKTMIALYGERDPAVGLVLAERTAETTRATSPVLTGLAILHAAEARGMLGERSACEQALAHAETAFARVDDMDSAFALYSAAQFGRMAGSCYLSLADTGRAVTLLTDTAAALDDGSKSQGVALGNLALALIRQGDLDQAAGRLHQAMDVVENNRGGGGLNIIFGAGQELRPWRSAPAVQDVHDRMLTLMAGLGRPCRMTSTDQAKQEIRERVWSLMETAGAARRGVTGYIPDFAGAKQAAERLAGLEPWRQARVVKVVPDRAQLPVRVRALEEGKLVYMAAPKLASEQPFYKLDPANLTVPAAEAAERDAAARIAPPVETAEMLFIDLVVVGSVAVNEQGGRLGKGAGYADLEIALLVEAGLVTGQTTIATTVHELQVLDEAFPELPHDFRVDLIATPERVIWCGQPRRPQGIDWHSLRPEQIAAIPALKRRAGQ